MVFRCTVARTQRLAERRVAAARIAGEACDAAYAGHGGEPQRRGAPRGREHARAAAPRLGVVAARLLDHRLGEPRLGVRRVAREGVLKIVERAVEVVEILAE